MKNILSFSTFNNLFHVGHVDIKLKSPTSMEGSGLSVSYHPEEWREIAKLGGSSVQRLSHVNGVGGTFLDYYKLSDDAKKTIEEWGVLNGCVNRISLFKIIETDEYERECFYLTKDADEAVAHYEEIFEKDFEDFDENEIIPSVDGLEATEKLLSISMQTHIDPLSAFEILTTVFIESETDFSGIFFDEDLDVSNFSAPRFVIFNSDLKNWTFSFVY